MSTSTPSRPTPRSTAPAPIHGVRRVDRPTKPPESQWVRKAALGAAAAVALLLLSLAGWSLLGGAGGPDVPLILYTVNHADLPIIVTERGNLESQTKTQIRNQVENQGGRNSGSSETQILFIVPNGSAVKKGDLLVELDQSAIRERLDVEILSLEQETAERSMADSKYENQKSLNTTSLANAELDLELAELTLKKYKDEFNGDYKLKEDDAIQKIEEAKNKILEAQASLELKKTERDGFQKLFELGYRGRAELDQKTYGFLQAQNTLASDRNNLLMLQATRDKLEVYDKKMELLTLGGAVNTAKRKLTQTEENNTALLAQALALKIRAESSEERDKALVARLTSQLDKCKIYAPHDGMVAYASMDRRRGSSSQIAEGTTVRQRQEILTLPNLSKMQVKTSVHESDLNQVYAGQPAVIRIDAFQGRTYRGKVKSVGVLPDRGMWGGSDVKVYETIVEITEDVEGLKPGMTAVVEIHVDRLRDVLSVPVTAVVQIGRDNWVYVENSGKVERRVISLGQTNDKFIHIPDGLSEGDQVVLNPMSSVDESQRDESGISPDEGGEDAFANMVADDGPTDPTLAGNLPLLPSEIAQSVGSSGDDPVLQEVRGRPRDDARGGRPGGGGWQRDGGSLTAEQIQQIRERRANGGVGRPGGGRQGGGRRGGNRPRGQLQDQSGEAAQDLTSQGGS